MITNDISYSFSFVPNSFSNSFFVSSLDETHENAEDYDYLKHYTIPRVTTYLFMKNDLLDTETSWSRTFLLLPFKIPYYLIAVFIDMIMYNNVNCVYSSLVDGGTVLEHIRLYRRRGFIGDLACFYKAASVLLLFLMCVKYYKLKQQLTKQQKIIFLLLIVLRAIIFAFDVWGVLYRDNKENKGINNYVFRKTSAGKKEEEIEAYKKRKFNFTSLVEFAVCVFGIVMLILINKHVQKKNLSVGVHSTAPRAMKMN
jgi:hypothetical protein